MRKTRQPKPAVIGGSEISTAFVIARHDLDVEVCSRAVGIPPTRVWRQARPDLRYYEGIANTQWILENPPEQSLSVDDEVKRLLERLPSGRSAIASFLRDSGAYANVSCNVTIHDERPDYSLSSEVVQRMAEIGAGFLLDIFDESVNNEEPE